MPLDPQVAAHYAAQRATGDITQPISIEEIRANADRIYNGKSRSPQVFDVQDTVIPGPCGGVPVRIYTPGEEDGYPALIYFHGGGFIMHNIASHDSLCRQLCKVCGCVVVNVGYRLAPEHPYPACMEDGYTALQWVHDNAARWRMDRTRIALAGDSAGANISAVVSLLARDRHGPDVKLQILCYGSGGCLSDEKSESMQAFSGGGYVLSKAFMSMAFQLYTQGKAEPEDPYLNPGRAKNLSGLPKSYVITAEYDPLRDGGEAFAKRLLEAGNDVTLFRVPGMMHGFLLLWEEFDRAQRVIDSIGTMVKETFSC